MNIYVEYESFCFEHIIANHLSEPSKSEFLKFDTLKSMIVDLGQTVEHVKIKRLVDLQPIDMHRQLVYDDQLARRMTNLLAWFEYVYLFHDWAQRFDKLK